MNEGIDITAQHGSRIGKQETKKHFATPPAARVLGSVIFFSLLVTIVLTAIPYGTVHPWWIATFDCIVFFICILGLIEAVISKRPLVSDPWLAAPLVALCLFMLFQSLPLLSQRDSTGLISLRFSVSADPHNTRLLAIKLFALVCAGLLLLRYTSGKKQLRALIYVVISVGLASALFGIMRKSFQQSPGFFLPALNNDDRGFAQFINRNHFGFLVEMGLGLTLGLLLGERGRRRTFVFLPMAAVLWIALVISNSRGGIVASLGELLFLGVLLDPLGRLAKKPAVTIWNRFQNLAGGVALRVILIACMVALFAYGVAWVGGESVVTNFQLAGYSFSQQGMDEDQRANTSRKDIWSSTWKLIKSRPLIGAGFGGYWIAITKYHDASGRLTPQEAHNDYLELLASGGIIGFALVIWFVIVFIRRALKNLKSPDTYYRAASLGALAGIFGVAIHSFVDFGLHITSNALVFCALIAITAFRPDEAIKRNRAEV
jgi:O-antigen ligase